MWHSFQPHLPAFFARRCPLFERVVQDVDEELDGVCGRDVGEAGASDGALLIEGAVAGGIGRRDDVVAEVTSPDDQWQAEMPPSAEQQTKEAKQSTVS